MALFDDRVTIVPAPRRQRPRATTVGIWSLTVAIFALLALTLLPTSFVIQQPGPVFNTLGSTQNASGEDVPLISVNGAQTYPTSGALDLLTVRALRLLRAADVVVTMGCGDACPIFPGKRYENWELPDPAGQSVESVRPIRDDIEERVHRLLDELGVAVRRS